MYSGIKYGKKQFLHLGPDIIYDREDIRNRIGLHGTSKVNAPMERQT